MCRNRRLAWEGCHNVRDLGGIQTADGRGRTRWGAVVRADSPVPFREPSGFRHSGLTANGWAALRAHGVRTIVNLREQPGSYPGAELPGIATVHIRLEDTADREFWRDCVHRGIEVPPLYYRAFLDRKFDRCAAAIAAVANARPGGVLVHCRLGRDRTGLISMLLLALAGVSLQSIIADYEYSGRCLRHMPDDQRELRGRMAARGTRVARIIADALASFDLDARLRAAGMTEEELSALRDRLLALVTSPEQ